MGENLAPPCVGGPPRRGSDGEPAQNTPENHRHQNVDRKSFARANLFVFSECTNKTIVFELCKAGYQCSSENVFSGRHPVLGGKSSVNGRLCGTDGGIWARDGV